MIQSNFTLNQHLIDLFYHFILYSNLFSCKLFCCSSTLVDRTKGGSTRFVDPRLVGSCRLIKPNTSGSNSLARIVNNSTSSQDSVKRNNNRVESAVSENNSIGMSKTIAMNNNEIDFNQRLLSKHCTSIQGRSELVSFKANTKAHSFNLDAIWPSNPNHNHNLNLDHKSKSSSNRINGNWSKSCDPLFACQDALR